MSYPESLVFTDFEIPRDQLFRHQPQGPMNPSWTRVLFSIPNGWDASEAIRDWMISNTPGEWQAYTYQNPKGKAHDYIMVVRFQDKNDALMFKLRGGHQAWESA